MIINAQNIGALGRRMWEFSMPLSSFQDSFHVASQTDKQKG
jgi:hypothetical protein